MFEEIKNCKKCSIQCNQAPLLDLKNTADIMFVGLSAKIVKEKEDIPLSSNTNSGRIIEKIEDFLKPTSIYRTNLVKCVPLDNKSKLRYPTKDEIDTCLSNLILEINTIKPKIVIPTHYGNIIGSSKDGEKFKKLIAADIECVIKLK